MEIEFETIKFLIDLLKKQFEVDLTYEISELVQVYSIEKYGLLSTIDIFGTHRHIQENITKVNAVEGYDLLLDNLQKEVKDSDFDVLQINIVTNVKGYILFTNLEINTLFGYLKMNKQKPDLENEYKEYYQLVGASRKLFLKGKKVTNP